MLTLQKLKTLGIGQIENTSLYTWCNLIGNIKYLICMYTTLIFKLITFK